MKVLNPDQATHRTRILRFNILIGFIAMALTTYLMITGDYTNIAERTAAEHLYNLIIIGSILYMVGTWIFCVLSRPYWKPKENHK